MSSKNRKTKGRVFLGPVITVLLLALLAGCASVPRSDDQKVVERSQARWDALLAGDLEKAYTFYTPGYRSANSLIDFGVMMRMRKVQWVSAEVAQADCEDSRCLVRAEVGYRVYGAVPGLKVWETTHQVEETWLKTSGEWWYLPEK